MALKGVLEVSRVCDEDEEYSTNITDPIGGLIKKTISSTTEINARFFAIQQKVADALESLEKMAESVDTASRNTINSEHTLEEILFLAGITTGKLQDTIEQIAYAKKESFKVITDLTIDAKTIELLVNKITQKKNGSIIVAYRVFVEINTQVKAFT